MKDAANFNSSNLENKLLSIKNKLPNVDENKLKSLEARFRGPSANGNLPYEFELITSNTINYDSQNAEKNNLKKHSTEITDKTYENNQTNSCNNNIREETSARQKQETKKAETNTKSVRGLNIDFLSTKRDRSENFISGQNNNSNSGMIIDSQNQILKNMNQNQNYKSMEVKEENYNNNFYNNGNQNIQAGYVKDVNIKANNITNENIKKQNSVNYNQRNKKSSNYNNNNSHAINSPSSVNNHQRRISNSNLVNISNLNHIDNINNSNNLNNNKFSHQNSNNQFAQAQSQNNNMNNLNKFLNIQNENFVHNNMRQELDYESGQFEEGILFSSKNIISANNLFYKNSNTPINNNNNLPNIKEISCNNNNLNIQTNIINPSNNNNVANPRPNMKNQMSLDQFSIKNAQNLNINYNNNSNGNYNSSNNLNRSSEMKINSYFNSNSGITNSKNSINNNCNSLKNSEDKALKAMKQNYLKLMEDNEKLIRDLSEKNKFLYDKEKENEKLKLILIENEENLNSINMLNKGYENQIALGRKSLIKYLKDNEDLKRNLNKIWLNDQAFNLGKFSIQRAGARLMEVWEDGNDIKNIKAELKEIKNNKDDLEKIKKRLAVAIKKKENKEKEINNNSNGISTGNNTIYSSNISFKDFSSVKENAMLLTGNVTRNAELSNINGGNLNNSSNNFLHPMNIYHTNNVSSLGNFGSSANLDDYTEHEIAELRELINFKLAKLGKDETDLIEKLEKLEIEKIKYQIEYKRNLEEEKCRYGNNSKEKWPVLANRYLILSLLGRGGYSEVYKAYDLENHIEVACKIHQLNPTWSDTIKENYIRHTIRENQIHKEINHPKVVKHYDTIEIDTSSFCTVLELCSGPDLYTYLKLNKTLTERDARIIISQILSGVEYLNKLQKKIIHYDLKPQNIIFNNMEVKISDFGLAKIMEDNTDKIELTSQGVGTYWYLPPECFDTDKNPPGISSKVDVWSIGVMLYELVFGVRPFGHSLTQDRILKENIITNAKKVEFPAKPVVSEDCKDFIKKCLAHNQDERYDVFEAMESAFLKGLNQKKTKV